MRPSSPRSGRERPKINNQALQRAMQYLGNYRRQAALPYLFLLVATLSPLVVPRLVRKPLAEILLWNRGERASDAAPEPRDGR